MNTNSNVYTVIYTTLVVVIVAAVLAFAAMKFKPMQEANVKAETLSQMMAAAQLGEKDALSEQGNDAVLKLYSESVEQAFTINLKGQKVRDLSTALENIEVIDNLKPQDRNIKAASENTEIPVYIFKGGITVVPIYGAGLWGPIWGYAAFCSDGCTLAGTYFDHASETPGLGAKIKDEPWFREKFIGKKVDFDSDVLFKLGKNVELGGGDNAVDAISGATMTSKGLGDAINVWFAAYKPYFAAVKTSAAAAAAEEETITKTDEEE